MRTALRVVRVTLVSIVVVIGFLWSFAPYCRGPVGITSPASPQREIEKIKRRNSFRLINPEKYSEDRHPWEDWAANEFRARVAVLVLGLGVTGVIVASGVARRYKEKQRSSEAPEGPL